MIISASTDYREAARRKLPPFLFHYIDGGAYAEYTLKRNVEDLAGIALRQRVLNNMSELSLETKLFNETLSMPVALIVATLRAAWPHTLAVYAFGSRVQGCGIHPEL